MNELQSRVDQALRETPEEEEAELFSDYAEPADDLTQKLMDAARARGVEAALDEFDRLRGSAKIRRLQRALMEFITHDPLAYEAGLHVPPLEERAAWKVTRDPDS